MCWNENISLNTFLFALVALIFIFYNNTYTQYKIDEFKNKYLYLFAGLIASMQLVDYFLWKSIKRNDEHMNKIASIIGSIIISLQPIAAVFSLPSKYTWLRNWLSGLYITAFVGFIVYRNVFNLTSTFNFKSVVDKNGHLEWKWLNLAGYEKLLPFLYFICFSTLFLTFPMIVSLFVFVSFIYSWYYLGNTYASMWCWYGNGIFLYYLVKILFILPFQEYNKIC